MQRLNSICNKEFQLVYYGRFTYSELDNMTVHEREMLYGFLVEQKTEERESYEKAVAEAKNRAKIK